MISFKFMNSDLTFRIGKHKDKHISDVDRFYLEWCVNEGREKMKPLEVDIFNAFIQHKKKYAALMESEPASFDSADAPPPGPVVPVPWMEEKAEELPF